VEFDRDLFLSEAVRLDLIWARTVGPETQLNDSP
jgi:hypothetical protein